MTSPSAPSINRLAAMMLLVAQDTRVGRTALNNILYVVDVAHVCGHGLPVSGIPYLRLQRGPTPREVDALRRLLINRGYLAEYPLESEIGRVFAYEASVERVDFHLVRAEFCAAELSTIDTGIEHLRPLPGEELFQAVRAFEPWISTDPDAELDLQKARDDPGLACWLNAMRLR